MTAQMVEAVKYRGFFQSTSKSATEQQTLGLLHDIYFVLVTYFEDLSQQDVVASGLVKQLKTYRFVLSLHFLLDVLTTLGQLSKTFQILAYHPCDACHKIAEVCDVLQDRYLRDTFRWGPKAAECIEKMEKGDIDVIEAGDEEKRKLRKDCIDFVTEVLNNLKSRFPRTQQGVVEATKIFNPGNLPNDDVLATYGEDELDVLSLHIILSLLTKVNVSQNGRCLNVA